MKSARIHVYCVLAFVVAFREVTSQVSHEQDCVLVEVRGALNGDVVGQYELDPSMMCSDQQVYRQLDKLDENYIYFFNNILEQLTSSQHTNNGGYQDNKPVSQEALRERYSSLFSNYSEGEEIVQSELDLLSEINDSAGSRTGPTSRERGSSSSSESDNSSESEEEEEEDVFGVLLGSRRRIKHQANPGKPVAWQYSIPGWMIGQQSCSPVSGRALSVGGNSGPSTTPLHWMEYYQHQWKINPNFIVTCIGAQSSHSVPGFGSGRQMIGFMLGISVFSICVMHALYKKYRRTSGPRHMQDLEAAFLHARPPTTERVFAPDTPPPPPHHPVRSPRNHIVIFTFPHAGSNSSCRPRADPADTEDVMFREDESEEEESERGRHLRGDVVSPPAYEEVSSLSSPPSESASGPQPLVVQPPPPTYEEAIAPVDHNNNNNNNNNDERTG